MTDMVAKTDFYLCLPSEADMPTLLVDFYQQDTEVRIDDKTGEEIVVNVGEPYLMQYTADYALDVVGVIQKATGNVLTDAEGNTYPEMATVPGWHVNIRLVSDAKRATVEALDTAYGVAPVTPYRVWA